MVKLSITAAAKAAIEEYCVRRKDKGDGADGVDGPSIEKLSETGLGSPIQHHDLVKISQYLVKRAKSKGDDDSANAARQWRLDTLLKGALVYQAPPPPKPEPTPEYKALMKRLRVDEERRQYERMTNPAPPAETFSQRFPNAAGPTFNPATSHGWNADEQVDDVTYADVNRQMILIINVIISIITCSVFIWIAARRWSVPQRLGLSMSGSGIVAAAEVAIYFGYIRRLQEAKDKETKNVERKEIMESWVIEKANSSSISASKDAVRFRKGKHR